MKNKKGIQITLVPLDELEYNIGQIPGVPENPRTREDEKQNKLKNSIEALPEMTIARPPMVYRFQDKYVVIGGNRRLEAFREIGEESVPIIELPQDTPVEKLRRIALLDNESTGDTDWGKVAKDWNVDEIKEWEIDVPKGWLNEFGQSNDDGSSDYDQFTDKFKPKLTTDDCYTPADVYELVKDMVVEKFNLQGKKIERPFKPGGDYEEDMKRYDDNTVVIDNPPFSIIAQIQRKYQDSGVKFFLFAPHLTLFSAMVDGISKIVTDATIVYANGASVNTSFVTNMFDEAVICTWCEMQQKIKDLQDNKKEKLPKYEFPKEVVTVNLLSKLMRGGVDAVIRLRDTRKIRKLESMGDGGIYGSGLLIGDNNADILEDALNLSYNQREKSEPQKEVFTLSAEEIEMVQELDRTTGEITIINNFKYGQV